MPLRHTQNLADYTITSPTVRLKKNISTEIIVPPHSKLSQCTFVVGWGIEQVAESLLQYYVKTAQE